MTVGVDGGEVVGRRTGSGASVVLPTGALEAPVEMRLVFSAQRPADLHADHATEKVAGLLTLSFARDTTLKLQPVWKFPLPQGVPNTALRPLGMGPRSVCARDDLRGRWRAGAGVDPYTIPRSLQVG